MKRKSYICNIVAPSGCFLESSMFRFLLFIFFLGIAFGGFSQRIVGKVVDQQNQQGIPMARITLVDFDINTLSDLDGNFAIEGKFPSSLLIRVSSQGYETVKFTAKIDKKELLIKLTPVHYDLEEVEVVASRNELRRNSVSHVELKSVDELNQIPTSSVGEMLEKLPGVYNSSTGMGISKPVIRGLQGTRVLTLLNGVRLENQQWGGDHGIGVSELGIGIVEVLKGPASLQYGADALGGVLYLSNEEYEKQGTHRVILQSLFESNTLGTGNSLLYKGSLKNLKIIAGGRFASYADYQIPEKDYLINSRFQNANGKLSLGWHENNWISNIRYDFSMATIGLPGHTHELTPQLSDFLAKNQERSIDEPFQQTQDHVLAWDNKLVWDKHTLQINLAATFNKLSEFAHEHDDEHDEDDHEHHDEHHHPELSIHTLNIPYKINVITNVNDVLSLTYGIQGMALFQKNDPESPERLLPDARQFDNGIYLISNWSLGKWRLQAGARGDFRALLVPISEEFEEGFRKNYAGFNFSVGGNYTINKEHILRTNVTSGFRIPHISELLSDGEHHGTFRYEIGDKNLRTEKAVQLDFAYEYSGKHLSLVFNPFVNGIQDYIYIAAQDSFINNVQVYHYHQAKDFVWQTGADIGAHYHPHFAHFLHIESTFSYLHVFAKDKEAYSYIPQPRWSTSISTDFEMKSKFKIDKIILQHHYYLPQRQVATFETSSVDYSLFDLGTQFSYGKNSFIVLQLGVKNIFNTKYINHLSRLKPLGVPNPGRSFYAKLKISI